MNNNSINDLKQEYQRLLKEIKALDKRINLRENNRRLFECYITIRYFLVFILLVVFNFNIDLSGFEAVISLTGMVANMNYSSYSMFKYQDKIFELNDKLVSLKKDALDIKEEIDALSLSIDVISELNIPDLSESLCVVEEEVKRLTLGGKV